MLQLIEYVNDSRNSYKIFDLAKEYERRDLTSPAISFYLRAAEFANDDLLAYTALCKAFSCYDRQGSRDASSKIMLENAIAFMPSRPEAYFLLSKFYQDRGENHTGYLFAQMGLQISELYPPPLYDDVGYEGIHALMFQKAVAGWWWGRADEAREIFQELGNEHWDEMSSIYQNSIIDNMSCIGLGPESKTFKMYDRSMGKLRLPFDGMANVDSNYSQAMQDLFVMGVCDKREGTFVEIGGGPPIKGSNTYLLEKEFGWTGVTVEIDQSWNDEYAAVRTTKLLNEDALKLNYRQLLNEMFPDGWVDYLQLDIEPPANTYACLKRIPFDTHSFGVITFEHDDYIDFPKRHRELSRKFLASKGYVLAVPDVSVDGVHSFEDWWVHPHWDVPRVKTAGAATNITDVMILGGRSTG